MLKDITPKLFIGLLFLSGCTPSATSGSIVSSPPELSYSDRVQQAGSRCSRTVLGDANGPGTVKMSSKLFQSTNSSPGSTVSNSVGVPYVEVPSDGSDPGHAWRSCMNKEGVQS